MDHKSLAKTLKLAKKRFEDKNNVFFKSLDAKIAGEMKFRASICRMLKSADSLLDMLQLCDELEDAGMHNIDAKKNLKALMNLSEKLKIESSLSRKRLKNLEKFANEIRCDFGIKPIKPILIPDSPPRPIRKSTRNNQIVSWISKVCTNVIQIDLTVETLWYSLYTSD